MTRSTPGGGQRGPGPNAALPGQDGRRLSVAGRLLVGLLTGYRRFVSPMLGARCRFYPSCSAYALEAVQLHGAGRGSWLAVRRLSRCHPFHPGGIDPVPGSGQDGSDVSRPDVAHDVAAGRNRGTVGSTPGRFARGANS